MKTKIKKTISNKKSSFYSMKSLFLLFVFTALLFSNVFSNNLNITNVVCNNPGAARPELTFNISWNNSWRTTSIAPFNYDAVWVFVKTQLVPPGAINCETTNGWTHADMSATLGEYSCGVPLEIKLVTDKKGIFIQRATDGTGNITPTVVTIRLENAAGNYNFKVFGIEMVYIPTGTFTLGDGSSTYALPSKSINGPTVQSNVADDVLMIGEQCGTYSIPTTYPNGYSAFYAMKYEITQQQYVEFLNTLTYDQQAARTIIAPNTVAGLSGVCAMVANCDNRNSIKLIQSGIATTTPKTPAIYGCDMLTAPGDPFNSSKDGKNIAMNYMKLDDLYYYLDWAALRPMTNLEYEKICRGPNAAVAGEYAWGSTNLTQAMASALSNPGEANELSTASGNGLCAYGAADVASNGPLRVGFAATATTNRVSAGASYYGVMDMSGNVWEMVVGGFYAHAQGYVLQAANNGDGDVSALHANWLNTPYTGGISTLPGTQCSGTNYWHFEFRGGSYNTANTTLRVSDRSAGSGNACSYYYCCSGGNGVMKNSTSFGYGNIGTQSRLKNAGGRGVRSYP
jgi:formylglycine-generating enzyme required for sulfatase activity